MRMEDEDPPTHTYVNYHLYDGSQPEGWYSTPNEVAEGIVECFSREAFLRMSIDDSSGQR